jgi:hypothetical protein
MKKSVIDPTTGNEWTVSTWRDKNVLGREPLMVLARNTSTGDRFAWREGDQFLEMNRATVADIVSADVAAAVLELWDAGITNEASSRSQ